MVASLAIARAHTTRQCRASFKEGYSLHRDDVFLISACDLEALQTFVCNPDDLFLLTLSCWSHGQSQQNV